MNGFLRCIECGAPVKKVFKKDPPLCPTCRARARQYFTEHYVRAR